MRSVFPPPPASLSLRRLFALLVGFIAACVAAHFVMAWAQSVSPVPLGVGRYFPVAYGHPRTPTPTQGTVAVLTIAGFAVSLRFFNQAPERLRHALAALIGTLTILGTTATHGWERGFVHPVAGREPRAAPAQYWHDAANQRLETGANALRFVRDYARIQPTLGEHGRTHPPGAVLFFAALRQATGNRAGIAAVLICAASVALVAIGFRLAGASPFVVLFFCVLPAVQVYFCATLDAVVAGLLFVAVTSLWQPARRGAVVGTLALFAASFLTFGVVWVVPVLLAVNVARTRRFPFRAAAMLAVVALVYGVVYAATGFDYIAAFRWASQSENPDGFRLFATPAEYVATRIENITDLLVFAGAFAPWAVWHGAKKARHEALPVWVAFAAGAASLALLFLAGAYRTGETARACLFLYPLAALWAEHAPLTEPERRTLLAASLALSAFFQCAGFYFW